MDYIQKILVKALDKWEGYLAKNKDGEKKRVIINPEEIFPEYNNNNVSIYDKVAFNDAVKKCLELNFISVTKIKFSSDIDKIYVYKEAIAEIKLYLQSKYDSITRDCKLEQLITLLNGYNKRGHLTTFYCIELEQYLNKATINLDFELETNILNCLDFLQNNKETLYEREMSQFCFSDTKYFEQKLKQKVILILKRYHNLSNNVHELNDDILLEYSVIPMHKEIFIKGDIDIHINGELYKTKYLSGGLGIESIDIDSITKIEIKDSSFITIENKTAYNRYKRGNTSFMYLAGYVNRAEVKFLKKVYEDNPNIKYFHFGDIDVGGFLIHKTLTENTGIPFELMYMGISELENPLFNNHSQNLDTNDKRINGLLENDTYNSTIKYMIENEIKMEQEIIAYYETKNSKT